MNILETLKIFTFNAYLGKYFEFALIWKYFVIQLNISPLILKRFWKTGVLSRMYLIFSSIFASKVLWHNKYINIVNETYNRAKIARKSLNFVCQVFNSSCNLSVVVCNSPVIICILVTAIIVDKFLLYLSLSVLCTCQS